MKTAVIVQIRLDSKRLPGKAIKKISDSTLSGKVLCRLRGIKADEYILATSFDCENELSSIAKENGFKLFLGPKEDVLHRYCLAIDEYKIDRVVRATGDNPFVSIPLAMLAIKEADKKNADYVGLLNMPSGMGVEVVKASSLKKAYAETKSLFDKEHVCPYLYNNPEKFIICRPECPKEYYLPNEKISIDTIEDFQKAKKIFDDLGSEPKDMEIIDWLKKHGVSK